MSVNKLISIKNPIVDAMDFLGLDHDKNIPFFTRLAVLAEIEIGSFFQYVRKRAVLDIKGCVANLPNDAEKIEVAIMSDLGCDCGDLTQMFCTAINQARNFSIGDTFMTIDIGSGTDDVFFGWVDYEIQNNKLIFAHNFDGRKVTVQYYAPETDCDGFVMIGQNHIQAIRWYIIYNYYFRKTGMNSLEYGKMKMAKEEWDRECSHARAQDAVLSQSDRARIVAMYHNPYAGRGLSVGMYTTLGNRFSIW